MYNWLNWCHWIASANSITISSRVVRVEQLSGLFLLPIFKKYINGKRSYDKHKKLSCFSENVYLRDSFVIASML